MTGPNESRLRCMLDPQGLWVLSDEDRAAIQWAFDRIATLEDDKERAYAERASAVAEMIGIRDRLESARDVLASVMS